MKHWTQIMGVGPFYYLEQAPIEDFKYHGESSELQVSIALSNSGPLQIELIQQRNDAPSMYRDFLEAGREGLQHVAYWLEQPAAGVPGGGLHPGSRYGSARVAAARRIGGHGE